jgi:hypothetical protein
MAKVQEKDKDHPSLNYKIDSWFFEQVRKIQTSPLLGKWDDFWNGLDENSTIVLNAIFSYVTLFLPLILLIFPSLFLWQKQNHLNHLDALNSSIIENFRTQQRVALQESKVLSQTPNETQESWQAQMNNDLRAQNINPTKVSIVSYQAQNLDDVILHQIAFSFKNMGQAEFNQMAKAAMFRHNGQMIRLEMNKEQELLAGSVEFVFYTKQQVVSEVPAE